jgi:hypothetical protein
MLSLREKIRILKEEKDREREKERRMYSRVEALRRENEELRKQNLELEEKINKLKMTLEESLKIAGKMGLIAYAENVSKVLDNPHILVEEVKKGLLPDVESINRRVEELKKEEIRRREREDRHEELDEEIERIRRMARLRERARATGRGLEYLYEDRPLSSSEKTEKVNVPFSLDLRKELESITGVDFETIKKLL